ncbi:MAG: hypothetical protein ACO25L_03790 [Candidatus Nanopelagicales bacterium]
MDENLRNRALKIFENDQNQLNGAFEKQSDVVVPSKIEKVSVVQNGNGTWTKDVVEEDSNLYDESVVGQIEKQIEEDAKTLQEFCAVLDNQIVAFNAQINAKKQEIVNLSIQANSGNCWPGIACSTLVSGGTTCAIGTAATTVNYATYTSIIEDRDALSIYENIAGPNQNFSADNPFDPDSVVTLTASYAGYGYENEKQNDGGTILSGVGRTDISGISTSHNARNVAPFRYYTGSTIPAATCVSIANSITTLLSEIDALRAQRDAAVNRTDLNSVKTTKTEKEFQDWGNKNLHQQIAARKTKYSTAIAAVQNIS